MTTKNNNIPLLEQQFAELLSVINYHRSRASQAVNEQQLLTSWNVGGFLPNYFVQTVTAQLDKTDKTIKQNRRDSRHQVAAILDKISETAHNPTKREQLNQAEARFLLQNG